MGKEGRRHRSGESGTKERNQNTLLNNVGHMS